MKDVDGKQEELRELVSVRYRDFIDAADTISAMGNSARTIIGAVKRAACSPASSHRGEGGQGGCSNETWAWRECAGFIMHAFTRAHVHD